MNVKDEIRTLVRTLYDFQDMRVRMGNRLKKKKDGTAQANAEDIDLDDNAKPVMKEVWKDAQASEKKLLKAIENELKGIPIYEEFLKDVKGIGPTLAGVIISEYDIHIATTVSKLWQFTGLNPGMVKGLKTKVSKKDGSFEIVKVQDMVKADKRTAGYMSPFNGWLRAKMIGVLAASFMKSGSPYSEFAYNLYVPLKKIKEGRTPGRLDLSEQLTHEYVKGKGMVEMMWKDTSEGHRNNAAKRYMIKMFLKDLYVAWRTIEGLEVRAPYQEEYLGHKH